MKQAALSIALLLFAGSTTCSGTEATTSSNTLAAISETSVKPGVKAKIDATSDQGFVLVALKHCSIFINGKSVSFKPGSYKRLVGKHSLELTQAGSMPIPFVIVEVLSTRQPLTIEFTTLDRHQEMEDASERGPTLLVAINDLQLSDVRDLADEGDHWKSSSEQEISLQSGRTAWLKAGSHIIRNLRNHSARFVTIEW